MNTFRFDNDTYHIDEVNVDKEYALLWRPSDKKLLMIDISDFIEYSKKKLTEEIEAYQDMYGYKAEVHISRNMISEFIYEELPGYACELLEAGDFQIVPE